MVDVRVTSNLFLGTSKPGRPLSRSTKQQNGEGKYSMPSDLAVNGRLVLGASTLWIVVLGLIIVSTVGWIVLCGRLRELQTQNKILDSKIQYLLCRLDLPNLNCDRIIKDNQADEKNDSPIPRSKRDLTSQNRTGRLIEVTASGNLNSNMSSSSNSTPSKLNDNKNFRQRIRGKLLRTDKQVGALKRVLKAEMKRASIACSNVDQRLSSSVPRAAYLVINGPEINIKSRGQLLGPWYIAKNGSEVGFDDVDLWYGQQLSLNYNATKIIFQESGLFLIYSQVYYHNAVPIGEKPKAMGYRITLKKNEINNNKIKRPIPIAECVPSHLMSAYQTCFTQVAWYIARGDELYLEHFTSSLPMVESGAQGQTFLGVVKL